MSDAGQNIQREIQAIEALNNFLVDEICNSVDQVNARFRGFIQMMAETGIPIQECNNFTQSYYAVDEASFKALYNQIVSCDLGAFQNYIEQLARQFQAATGTSYGGVSLHRPSPVSTQTPSNATERRGSTQDYDIQIDALCDFMNYLVGERDQLANTLQRYERYCNNMVEQGVPIQIVNHYVSNFARVNVEQIKRIIGHIQTDDYKQLTGIYTEIANSMAAVSSTPKRSPQSM